VKDLKKFATEIKRKFIKIEFFFEIDELELFLIRNNTLPVVAFYDEVCGFSPSISSRFRNWRLRKGIRIFPVTTDFNRDQIIQRGERRDGRFSTISCKSEEELHFAINYLVEMEIGNPNKFFERKMADRFGFFDSDKTSIDGNPKRIFEDALYKMPPNILKSFERISKTKKEPVAPFEFGKGY